MFLLKMTSAFFGRCVALSCRVRTKTSSLHFAAWSGFVDCPADCGLSINLRLSKVRPMCAAHPLLLSSAGVMKDRVIRYTSVMQAKM